MDMRRILRRVANKVFIREGRGVGVTRTEVGDRLYRVLGLIEELNRRCNDVSCYKLIIHSQGGGGGGDGLKKS